jgi:hypothetical protein
MLSDKQLIEAVKALGFHSFDCKEHSCYLVNISLEHGDDAGDFYGEYRGGYPWINPKLEQLARSNDAYWEWINPGHIGLLRGKQ